MTVAQASIKFTLGMLVLSSRKDASRYAAHTFIADEIPYFSSFLRFQLRVMIVACKPRNQGRQHSKPYKL
jgi:hypothetical protein